MHTPARKDEVTIAEGMFTKLSFICNPMLISVEVPTPTTNEAKLPSPSGSPSPPRSASSSPGSPPTLSLTPESLIKIRDFWADPDPEEKAICVEAKTFETIDLSFVLKKLAAEDESAMCVDFDFDNRATAVDLESESEWDPYGDSSTSLVAVEAQEEPIYCDR